MTPTLPRRVLPLHRRRWHGARTDRRSVDWEADLERLNRTVAALRRGGPVWHVIDVSNWQPDDIRSALAQVDGVVCQAGVPRFAEHIAQAAAMGKAAGAYFWCYPQRDVGAELARFAAALAPVQAQLTIRSWLDVETTPGLVTPPPAAVRAWLAGWFEARREDGIYTSQGEWAEMTGGSALFAAQQLWVAAYGVASPNMPAGWGSWAGWQYTASAVVGGIPNLDMSVMDPTRVLLNTDPGDIVGKYGIGFVAIDERTPPDAKGRIPWWGVDRHGAVFNWNGARPVAGLPGLRPPVARDDVCGAVHTNGTAWYPEGLVVCCDDGAADGSEWAASAYHLPVPAPPAHAEHQPPKVRTELREAQVAVKR